MERIHPSESIRFSGKVGFLRARRIGPVSISGTQEHLCTSEVLAQATSDSCNSRICRGFPDALARSSYRWKSYNCYPSTDISPGLETGRNAIQHSWSR